MDHQDIKILHQDTAYKGFFTIRRYELRHKLFGGGWSDTLSREVFDRAPVAAALPYDPVRDEVVLIEQFRIGALAQDSPWLIELVAGIREGEESAEAMVHREMQEEAGLKAKQLIHIHNCWSSPGGSNEYLSLFCAIVDASTAGGIHGLAIEHEDIRVFTVPSQTAFDYVASGKINNAASIIALQWLQLNLMGANGSMAFG